METVIHINVQLRRREGTQRDLAGVFVSRSEKGVGVSRQRSEREGGEGRWGILGRWKSMCNGPVAERSILWVLSIQRMRGV